MKKILVTGSEGFLASRFIKRYNDQYDITALSRKELDITNESAIYQLFKNKRFDLVFHSAAISNTMSCEEQPDLAQHINTLGTQLIARGCELQGSKLIFTSSDQVYNGTVECGPYLENQACPNSVYAHTKFEAEKRIANELDSYYNLRLTWLFSLPESHLRLNQNVFMNIINAVQNKTPLSMAAHEFRGMTYVYDVIDQLIPMLQQPYGTYNFGSENDLCSATIGKEIAKRLYPTYASDSIVITDFERFKDSPRDLRISTDKLKECEIHFPTTIEGIEKCLFDFSN
ncbi:MAG TPA: NAD(P)-dependent oxidoreductase [Firmicutes bacterium]|nr:NAD(P)-dependent oxidoreductase [Bacillota bacterium]